MYRMKRALSAAAVFLLLAGLSSLTGCCLFSQAPVASFTATPTTGPAPLTVNFDASASYDPDGRIENYKWDFGDGSAGYGVVVTHTFAQAKDYIVRLTVRDDCGKTASTSQTIKVTGPVPSEGKIAFYRFPGPEIYVINVDGSDYHRITFADHDFRDPDWSPDGTRIAFTKGNWRIWVVDADGGNLHEIPIDEGINARHPAWSPDGTRIAFSCSLEGQDEICVVNIDGSGFQKLTHLGDAQKPDWSPDGTKLAFTRRSEVWVMNTDGSNPHRVTSCSSIAYPAWSPDGRKIAFDKSAEIWVVDAHGGNPHQLIDPGWHPTWSPDGTKIAFLSRKYKGFDTDQYDIYIMNADGSDVHNITNTLDISEYAPDWSPALP